MECLAACNATLPSFKLKLKYPLDFDFIFVRLFLISMSCNFKLIKSVCGAAGDRIRVNKFEPKTKLRLMPTRTQFVIFTVVVRLIF